MTNHIARIISATALGTVLTGCATVPGDPYYQQQPSYQVYEQPGYIYSAPPVYSSPPVYRAPPAVYYGGRDNRDDRWDNHRDRDRDRAERDRLARDRADRDRREQQARDAANRDRARDQARREQAERDRRAEEDRRNREQRPGRLAPGSYTPHPHDWRSRQFENSGEKP